VSHDLADRRESASLTKPSTRAILLIILGGLLLSGCQDFFVYHPRTDNENSLLSMAREKGLEPWYGSGGERIGWYAGTERSEEAQRVIIFHGNGGQAVDRDHYVRGFQGRRAQGAWEVYILEYPGYGSRPGKPSEGAFIEAAREGVKHILREAPDEPLYVVGTSLGSGVASQIAAAYSDSVPAVLLITPFTNIEDVGAKSFPRFLLRLLLKDRYDNEKALSDYTGRLGVLLAGDDRVVPTELGRRLYDGYEGPKRLWIQPRAGHNTLDYHPSSEFWTELTGFFVGSE
jgi:hypothetical protein